MSLELTVSRSNEDLDEVLDIEGDGPTMLTKQARAGACGDGEGLQYDYGPSDEECAAMLM